MKNTKLYYTRVQRSVLDCVPRRECRPGEDKSGECLLPETQNPGWLSSPLRG